MKRKNGSDVGKPVEKVRNQLVPLAEETEQVAKAPATKAEREARVDAIIDYKAKSWEPTVGVLASPTGPNPATFDVSGVTRDGLEALVCALWPDRVRELLLERAAKHLGERPTLTAEERAAKLGELERRRIELEREEERLIRQAEAEGRDIPRRGDADPAVVLGLA